MVVFGFYVVVGFFYQCFEIDFVCFYCFQVEYYFGVVVVSIDFVQVFVGLFDLFVVFGCYLKYYVVGIMFIVVFSVVVMVLFGQGKMFFEFDGVNIIFMYSVVKYFYKVVVLLRVFKFYYNFIEFFEFYVGNVICVSFVCVIGLVLRCQGLVCC